MDRSQFGAPKESDTFRRTEDGRTIERVSPAGTVLAVFHGVMDSKEVWKKP